MKHMNTDEVRLNTEKGVPADPDRKTAEIDGTCKKYFESKHLRHFPSTSDQFLPLIGVKRSEVTGEIRRSSGPEY
jgi:hypothetical protein